MTEIRFISIDLVQATSHHHGESTHHRIELTPWDLQLLLVGPIQKGLLFLKPTPTPTPTPSQSQQQLPLLADTIVDHLKISFSRTLDFFPLLAGRLGTIKNDDNTSSFFIDCNNAGAHFIHAIADNVTVSDILGPVHVPRLVHSFFPLNGYLNHEGTSKPLLAVQVTKLVDGFFVGCTMNHAVVDGSCFWQFFNSWSEIARGSDKISRPPVLNRWFPSDVDCPIRIPFSSEQISDTFILPKVEEMVFHFTKEKIAKLKAKANAEMNTTTISSLQALLAHLWRSVVSCQNINDTNQEVKYVLLVSARPRLRPPLPEGYFGNTINGEILHATAEEVVGKGLGWVAWQMNKAIALQTNDGIRKLYEDWVKNPKLMKMGVLTNNALTTSSSPRFNVYGNDFGWGKPVAVRSGSANKSDGKITVFPGVEEGSIEIEVCLLPEKLVAMRDDEEFMEAVTM
ncbi:putative acetyltransferase [Camellia lanceoleosa]|uniref:Acetyltransferase n=1 Tax=Camellia lanceoleosa TaxID=1840588 RepID=A0ACC0G921_9ERIC|nr:putative acetyltransferase [Camellia lanceoleosa]